MINTPFIRECILNKEKTRLIPEAIAAGNVQYGMQTFDQSLFFLYKKNLITYEEALRWASKPDEFKLRVQGIQSTSDIARELEESVLSYTSGLDMEETETPVGADTSLPLDVE
jgi:twitching motility protein PilT